MDGFNVDSTGLTRREFTQSVHRLARSFFLGVIGIAAAIYLAICLIAGFNLLYAVFPGSIAAALLLYYEMKAQANYGKFDYEGLVFHFRFEPERWVVIRGNELNTRAEYTWAETGKVLETGKNLLLVPTRQGSGNYTLPKRSITDEQRQAIQAWQAAAQQK